jgi:tetratricopeptide (TPR) repeat protein
VSATALLAEAERAAAAKEWDRAADVLSDAGESPEILDKRAFYLSRAGRYEEALAALGRWRKLEPRSARAAYATGFQFSQQQRWDEAIRWYEAALELSPNYLKAFYRLARAHEGAGHERHAQLAAARVVRLWAEGDDAFKEQERVKYARACHMLAKLHIYRHPQDAVEFARLATANEPNDHNKHYLLGKALNRVGSHREALAALEQASRLKPRQSFTEIETVRALLYVGEREAAATRLKKVARNCRGWDAYNAGRLARELGELLLARDLLRTAHKRGPARGSTYVERELAALGPVPAAAPGAGESTTGAGDATTGAGEATTGEIIFVKEEKRFGFLRDQAGVERHFRFRGEEKLRRGGKVTFVPVDAEKGPAARDVRLAS